MKWTRGYQSGDVEDRRGQPGGGRGLPTGILALIGSRYGIGGVILALIAYAAFQFLSPTVPEQNARNAMTATQTDERVQFVSFVLDDVQNTWAQKMTGYERARLVVYTGGTETGCGYGDRAVGPFYCPADQRVYLDLEFFDTLSRQLGARGDFAQAYVIAHEIGHHVQNLMGTTSGRPTRGAEGTSVKLELQADCYAGVWANTTQQRQLLEKGDLDEALDAAAAVGDDRLQKMGRGGVRPETWTHGSSEQRRAWFMRGLETGDPQKCDTFETAELTPPP